MCISLFYAACVCTSECVHVYHHMYDSSEVRRHWMARNQKDRWLWPVIWMLVNQTQSSGGPASSLNHWAISPALLLQKKILQWDAVVAHAFNPHTREAEAGRFLWFQGQLDLQMSSRTSRAVTEKHRLNNNKKPKAQLNVLHLCI